MGTVYPYPLFRFRRALSERFKAVQAYGRSLSRGYDDPALRRRCVETNVELTDATNMLHGGDK